MTGYCPKNALCTQTHSFQIRHRYWTFRNRCICLCWVDVALLLNGETQASRPSCKTSATGHSHCSSLQSRCHALNPCWDALSNAILYNPQTMRLTPLHMLSSRDPGIIICPTMPKTIPFPVPRAPGPRFCSQQPSHDIKPY